MEAVATPVTIQRTLPPEEAARGDFYALLARLLHGAPDAALLASLAAAPSIPRDGNGALAAAWQGVVDASKAMDADAALEEYEALFSGVGKSRVSPFAGFYSGAPAIDHPRVRIQRDMEALGLAPRAGSTEPEDHLAALFDVMRVLATGGAGRAAASLAEQRKFFQDHVQPGAAKFFAALAGAPEANYYRKVAALGAAIISIETESFLLD
jgi:TorA maturation chaperone TorD